MSARASKKSYQGHSKETLGMVPLLIYLLTGCSESRCSAQAFSGCGEATSLLGRWAFSSSQWLLLLWSTGLAALRHVSLPRTRDQILHR